MDNRESVAERPIGSNGAQGENAQKETRSRRSIPRRTLRGGARVRSDLFSVGLSPVARSLLGGSIGRGQKGGLGRGLTGRVEAGRGVDLTGEGERAGARRAFVGARDFSSAVPTAYCLPHLRS